MLLIFVLLRLVLNRYIQKTSVKLKMSSDTMMKLKEYRLGNYARIQIIHLAFINL